MKVSASVDDFAFKQALLRFIHFQRISLATGLRIQSAHLAERLIRFTPPKTQAQGKQAVARDIKRVYSPLDYRIFGGLFQRLIQGRDYDTLQRVISSLKGGPLAGKRVVQFSPTQHREARDRRGRIRRDLGFVTPDRTAVMDYIKKIQSHVGEAKGGWAVTVRRMAARANIAIHVPGWISRHERAGDTVDLADAPTPSVILENKSEWAGSGDADRVVSGAVRARIRDIESYIRRSQADALRKAGL